MFSWHVGDTHERLIHDSRHVEFCFDIRLVETRKDLVMSASCAYGDHQARTCLAYVGSMCVVAMRYSVSFAV